MLKKKPPTLIIFSYRCLKLISLFYNLYLTFCVELLLLSKNDLLGRDEKLVLMLRENVFAMTAMDYFENGYLVVYVQHQRLKQLVTTVNRCKL